MTDACREESIVHQEEVGSATTEKPPEENALRWFRIRKANIDPTLRDAYEQYGVVSLQLDYAMKKYMRGMPEGEPAPAHPDDAALLAWLTEQYDRTERKETWGLTLEVVITVFIAVEVLSLFSPALHWLIP